MTGILNLLLGAGGVIKDTYFNLVSLLLPGNGTNGAQNNTFLDGSSNNFTITRNGNTTQGTFSPFSQTGWGAYFDGSNDYISIADNAAIQVGQTYTIEGWFFPTTTAQLRYFGKFSFGVGGYLLLADSTSFTWYYANNGTATITGSWSPNINAWNHIAVSSNSSTMRVWLNGTSIGSVSSPAATQNDSGALRLGDYNGTAAAAFAGYQSNFRIVKGSVVYNPSSTSITVPTSPLTAVTDTTLLICQSNRFRDASVSNLTVSPINGVAITPFSPFAPTQSYSAAAVGGSGYFDGTGDYLTTQTGQTALTLGTGSFTISFWFYCPAQVQSNGSFFATNTSATYTNAIIAQFSNSTATTMELAMGGSILKSGISVVPNQWNFVVIQRTAPSTMQIWVNGSEVTGVTASSANLTDNDWRIGYWFLGAHAITGYLSNFRILKGTALYSGSTITVPTAPLGSTGSDTSLLLNFTNAGVVDATAKNDLETVGNAQISTTQSKWGGGSIYFASASNSNLLGNTPSNWTFLHDGSTWTVEFWLYPTDISSFQGLIATNGAGSTSIGLAFVINAGTINVSFTRGVSGSSASFTSSAVLNANQWNYVGVTFTGSTKTCAFFINGASAGSSSNTGFAYSSSAPTYPPYIGQTGSPGFPYYFNGYIDDLRITRGVARTITANPTAPFPVQ